MKNRFGIIIRGESSSSAMCIESKKEGNCRFLPLISLAPTAKDNEEENNEIDTHTSPHLSLDTLKIGINCAFALVGSKGQHLWVCFLRCSLLSMSHRYAWTLIFLNSQLPQLCSRLGLLHGSVSDGIITLAIAHSPVVCAQHNFQDRMKLRIFPMNYRRPMRPYCSHFYIMLSRKFNVSQYTNRTERYERKTILIIHIIGHERECHVMW